MWFKMSRDYNVTPWDVSGDVDYNKLITDFGIKRIDESLLGRIKSIAGEVHPYLRRQIFFAHRDLKWVLDEYDKGNKFYLYTGRSPSGDVHLGHLMPWYFTRWLQEKFGAELWFQFPDEEKFLFKKNMTLKDTEHYLHENMLDVIACGFDPKKTNFLIDTRHAGIMYKEALKVSKKITYSTVKSSFGFNNDSNIGQIFYTSMQAVPSFLPSVIAGRNIPCLIPHAVDQDPHFRVTRDVVQKLGHYKPASIQCRFLPPLQGVSGKMSSSVAETAIYSTDSQKDVRKKINKYAYSGGRDTLEEHRKLGGRPEVDIPYNWLMFFEEDDRKLAKIYDDYKSGALLSGEIKSILIDKINSILSEHQKRREEARDRVDEFIYRA